MLPTSSIVKKLTARLADRKNRRALRQVARRTPELGWTGLEELEPRVMLSAVLGNGTLNGTLGLTSLNQAGTIVANGTGGITGGALETDAPGSSTISGTSYSIASNGAATLSLTGSGGFSYSGTGAIDSAGDVVALANTNLASSSTDSGLTEVINPGTGTFSDANLANSTWNWVGGKSRGTIVFGAGGVVSGGEIDTITLPGGFTITGGSYSVSASGAVSVTITYPPGSDSGTSLTLNGTINASGDVIALANSALGTAGAETDNITLIQNTSATFAQSTMAGTWYLADSGSAGTVTFNGTGAITGGSITLAGNSTAGSVTGTYNVTRGGKLTINATVTTPGSTPTTTSYVLVGEINDSQDVAVVDNSDIGDAAHENLGVLIQSTSNQATIGSLTTSAPVAKGQTLTLTANDVSIPTPGLIKSVLFYSGTGAFDAKDDILLGQGTTTDGSTYVLTARTGQLPVGTDTFFAQVVDSFGRLSPDVATATGQITDTPPTIGSLVTVPKAPAAGNTILIQAIGVGDPYNTIANVKYYWDPSGTGTGPVSGDVFLGEATKAPGNWSIPATLPTATADVPFPTTGDATFVAVATDLSGTQSAPAVLTEEVSTPPSITSLTVNPTTAGRGTIVTLTANDVTLGTGGPINHVGFWIDNLGTGVINETEDTFVGLGIQQAGTSNWSLSYHVPKTVVLTDGSATITFLAQAGNGKGGLSAAAKGTLTVTAAAPVIASLVVSPTTINASDPYTLTAKGVVDPDGTPITQVVFYSDPNNTGSITGTGVTILGTVPIPSGTLMPTVSLALTAPSDLPPGTVLYFLAQATNSLSQTSNVAASGTLAPPVIGSLAATPSPVDRDHQLTITADNVSDSSSTIKQVTFYLGPIGATTFNATLDKSLGLATETGAGTGNWAKDVLVPTNLPLGTYPLFAVAVNAANQRSNVVTTNVTVDDDPPFTGVLSIGSPSVVAADNTITLRVVGPTDPGSKVASVNFYWSPSGTDSLTGAVLLGTSSGPSIWNTTVTLNTATLGQAFPQSGTAVFLAQAVDALGTVGNIAKYTANVVPQPVMGTLTASPTPLDHTQTATLTASGITDSDGNISKVQFWLAPSGSTSLDTGTDTQLPLGVLQSNGDWVVQINQRDHLLEPGSFVIFARALGSNGAWSDAISIPVTVV